MAYEVIILYHLHMPCILWEHLLNIPNLFNVFAYELYVFHKVIHLYFFA